MELLSATLADQLSEPLSGQSPLAIEQILVQSPGMSTWLRLEIAKHNGIAAGVEFPLPSSFIWELCHALLPNVPKENAFTKAAMTWKLLSLLPSLIDQPLYAPLKRYLDSHSSQPELKRYQLAARIADIFDQYLVYRPDWIAAWEANEAPFALSDEQAWQPALWRELVAFNRQLGQSAYHRANLHEALVAILEDDTKALPQLPARLFVFGISSIPPQTLSVLQALGHRIPVTVLSLSPCQHYWGDIVNPKARARINLAYGAKRQLPENWQKDLVVGNPLLANNGKLGRELLDLMLELPPEAIELGDDLFYPNGDATLLQGIQQDILEMETRGQLLGPDSELYLSLDGRRVLTDDDQSLLLRSCHSPLREVETLHDHLLWMLSNHPELEAKDIVVMLPDVAAYAPYIDAVFSRRDGQYYLPYAIADRGASQESPLISAFLALLDIHRSRFALTDILAILEVPATLKRFGLDSDELALVRQWLDRAGVRWGRSAQSRTQQQLPAFEQNSWAAGLKRLILGYALEDDAELFHGQLAVPGVEGQNAQALGKLFNFIESIDEISQQLAEPATIDIRVQQLSQLCADFYDAEDERDTQALMTINSTIAKLESELFTAGFVEPLDNTILQQWFSSQLEESRVGQRYLAGAINFCTLMPMRSIPFKVVCLLGMNDGLYPRVQHPVGFDLMAQRLPRKGDRSRRLDDRYLFLEALLSARQQLYISYVGRSQRDNSPRNPSMLIAELLEYCQLTCVPAALLPQFDISARLDGEQLATLEQAINARLIKQQPLQPFDVSLYQPELLSSNALPLTPSFSPQWCPTPLQQARPEFMDGAPLSLADTEVSDDNDIIELQALVRFYRNPAQYFFNRSLKLDLSLSLNADDNDEPFKPDAFQRYQLQSLMLFDALEHDGILDVELSQKLKASGRLPNAPFDELTLNEYRRDIAPILERSLYLRGDSQKKLLIDVPLSDLKLRLQGHLDNVAGKGLVDLRPGRAKGRDIIRLYLRHLAMNAMGVQRHSYLLDMHDFHAFAPLLPEQAVQQLTQWLQRFIQGQQQPLMLPPNTALAYAQSSAEDHAGRLNDAQSTWQGGMYPGEGSEPHWQRCFTFPDDFDEANFGTPTLTLLTPLVGLYHQGKLKELADYVSHGGAEGANA